MQIIRVEKNVGKSIVTGIDVDNVSRLPEALRKRMIKLLNMLKGVKKINIKDKAEDAIFELSDTNVTICFFNRKTRREFIKIIDLLWWYQEPHWRYQKGVLGAPAHCVHCDYAQPSGYFVSYCPSPGCPSHEKWRQIIGPQYKIPGDFSPAEKRRIKKIFKESNFVGKK